MEEYVPTLNVRSEAGTINLFDYLKDKRSGNADYLDKPSERVERERAAGSQGVPKEQAAICHRSCPVHVHYICGICPVQNRTSSGQVAGR